MGALFPVQRQGRASVPVSDELPAAGAFRAEHRREDAHVLPLDQPGSVPDAGPRHDHVVHQPETLPVSGTRVPHLRRVSCADIPLLCLYPDGDSAAEGEMTALFERPVTPGMMDKNPKKSKKKVEFFIFHAYSNI